MRRVQRSKEEIGMGMVFVRIEERHNPTPEETDGEAKNPGPGRHRLRRRGPRSDEASERRSFRWNNEPRDVGQEVFDIWHVNIQGLMTVKKGIHELAARIRAADAKPSLVCITETWLCRAVEEVSLEGYVVVSRRDRDENSGRGGVLLFAIEDLAESVTELEKSKEAERLWTIIHTKHGPYMIGVWYRPPQQGETESIRSLGVEANNLREGVIGTLLCGDMNVHQQKWLRHSSGNTAEGELLQKTCEEQGLRQLVSEPTRKITSWTSCLVMSRK